MLWWWWFFIVNHLGRQDFLSLEERAPRRTRKVPCPERTPFWSPLPFWDPESPHLLVPPVSSGDFF